jgi:hypothetical protein
LAAEKVEQVLTLEALAVQAVAVVVALMVVL